MAGPHPSTMCGTSRASEPPPCSCQNQINTEVLSSEPLHVHPMLYVEKKNNPKGSHYVHLRKQFCGATER